MVKELHLNAQFTSRKSLLKWKQSFSIILLVHSTGTGGTHEVSNISVAKVKPAYLKSIVCKFYSKVKCQFIMPHESQK